jgi:hypothetical protein
MYHQAKHPYFFLLQKFCFLKNSFQVASPHQSYSFNSYPILQNLWSQAMIADDPHQFRTELILKAYSNNTIKVYLGEVGVYTT